MNPSESAPIVELAGVSRVFEDEDGGLVRALEDVSLRIHPGEFVCVTGPSGSGKSTLLNIMGCLDRATEGNCRIAGTDVATLDEEGHASLRRRVFGFVFQSYNLLDSLTALGNVELPATYAGIPATNRRGRARGILESIGLGDRLDHQPSELSGGEQQRVAIARALMNDAPVILADEPTGAIDSAQGDEVLDLLEALSERGHTVIVVSHDRVVADRAQRVVELADGRIVADSGPPEASVVVARSSTVGGEDAPRSGSRGVIPWLTAARDGLHAMRTGRLRAALSVFSVTLGTWSVLALLGLSAGVGRDIGAALERMGANRLTIMDTSLTLADADAIAEVANVRSVAPSMWERLPASHGGEIIDEVIVRAKSVFEPRTTQNLAWPLAEGTYLTQRDTDEVAQVAVIGPTVRKRLFAADEDALGQHVDINGTPFAVKGVLAPHPRQVGEGEMMWSGPNAYDWLGTVVHIPFKTGANILFGRENLNRLDVFTNDVTKLDDTAADIDDVLFRLGHQSEVSNHGLIWTSGKKVKQIHVAILGAIGGVALLLGGLTTMAVSLAGVRQRKREIGIRMAVGARRRDITAQFVVETSVATAIGGAVGALLGFAGSPLLAHVAGAPVATAPWFLVVALGCAAVTGLVFGIVPARRAAQLDPVAALASE